MARKNSDRPSGWKLFKNNLSFLLVLSWAAVIAVIAISALLYWRAVL